LASCAATEPQSQRYQSALSGNPSFPASPVPDPDRQLSHAQGFIGSTHLDISNIDIDSALGSVQSSDSAEMPLIGGALQLPLGGKQHVHVGLEGGFTLGFRSDIEAFALGSNGAVVVADNDVFLTDIFGGIYGDIDFGGSVRIYAGVGPTFQFAQIDYDYDDPVLGHVHINDDGFGTGYYSRVGVEFSVGPGMAFGVGYRYVDSSADFGGPIDSMDLRQEQFMVTFTQSY
jgi:opacity protein-like surface antigen